LKARVGLTQRVDVLAERGERRDALDQQWARLLNDTGHLPVPIPNRLADQDGYVHELRLDLVVLTGGNDIGVAPERDQTETTLLDLALAGRFPVLGVCRGLQMLIHHSGGRLVKVQGHVGGTHTTTLTRALPWPLAPNRSVNSYHSWGARPGDLPGDLVPLAIADDGTVEAAAHARLPIVGVMWHPERSPEHEADLALLAALLEQAR
jgi:putative glutamine amidotransferase